MDDQTPTVETTTAAPTSFSQAAAALEASSASPSTETPAPETAPAATAQAGTDADPSSGATPEPGPPRSPDGRFVPPEHRWPQILENQRTKATKEAEDRVRAEYAWANGIQEEQRAILPQALQFAQWVDRDPRAALTWLQQQVEAQHPAAPPPAAEPKPDAQIRLEDGTLVPVYTAEGQQARDKWLLEQFTGMTRDAMQPFDGVMEAYQVQQANTTMAAAISDMEKRHQHFAAHKADVLAEMKADPELWEFAGHYPARAMQVAFARVMEAKVLPTLAGQERSQVVANLQRKTAATTIRPSNGATTLPRRPKTFAEAARRMSEEG